MVQIPTRTNARATPSGRGVVVPGPQNVQAVGRQEGSGVPNVPDPITADGEVGASLFQVGAELKQAEDRIQARRDTLSRVRDWRELRGQIRERYQSVLDSGDPTDEEHLKKFGAETQSLIDQFAQRHSRTEETELRFREGAQEIFTTFADTLAKEGVLQGKKNLRAELREHIAPVIDKAANSNENLGSLIMSVVGEGGILSKRFRDGFTGPEEAEEEQAAIKEILEARFDRNISFGDPEGYDAAEGVLEYPGARAALGDDYDKMRDRLRKAKAPKKRNTAVVNGVLIDVDTEEVIFPKGAKAPPTKSDLTDESGNVKTETSSGIRQQTAQFLGGGFDIASGSFTGLSESEAAASLALATEAERAIRSGEASGVAEAVTLAATRVKLPERTSFTDIAEKIIVTAEAGTKPTDDQLATAPQRLQTAKANAVHVADATGISSGFVDFLFNNLLSQLNPAFVDADVARARQKLALLEGEFITSFNRAPRLPVWEQVRLSKIFSGPSALNSPAAAKIELANLDGLLTSKIDQRMQMLEISNFPAAEKQKLLNEIGALAGFRSRIRAFDIEEAKQEAESVESVPITNVEEVGSASDAQIDSFLRNATVEELSALPPEVRSAIAARKANKGGSK